ncbi:MAG: hypothetical protein ACKOFU_04770 [Actinomycetota bacterium]
MKRVRVLAVTLSLLATLVIPTHSTAETVEQSRWWRNGGLWQLTDNCVESIEFFNETSQKWELTLPEKNPDWVPNWVISEEYRQTRNKIDPVLGQCGHGESIGSADCYLAKGAGSKGEDLLLQTIVYGESEEVKLNFTAFNGQISYVRPVIGDRLFLLPPNSRWRMTVISELFANDAGIARAQMKEPNIEVFKGSDGKSRIRAEGRVQEIFTIEPNKSGDPSCDDVINTENDYTANRYATNFSINVSRYKYEYEKLKGSPPAGVFITENGGCFSRLEFDTERRIITVAVGAPHFDINGKVIEGWVQASIRGDVIRKAFNAEPKTMNEALIQVSYADGTSKQATSSTKYIAESDKVEIRAYGFTFSAPTIKMTLRPLVSKATKKGFSSITCVKGKIKKTFTAKAPAKPACPKGWKKA